MPESNVPLSPRLQVADPVRFLDFSENGTADARGLCSHLAAGHIPSLTSLKLAHNKLESGTLAALGDSLPGVPALQTLTLSGNALGDAGLQAVAAGFRKGGLELLFLDLRKCGVGDVGAKALAVALCGGVLPKLRELTLRENAIGEDETLSALADALSPKAGTASSIVSIELQENPFKTSTGLLSKPPGFKALTKACKASNIRLGV